MFNYKAIYDFVNHWQDHSGFEIAETGNCKFPAVVEYKFGGKVIESNTRVSIIHNGYEDGKSVVGRCAIKPRSAS